MPRRAAGRRLPRRQPQRRQVLALQLPDRVVAGDRQLRRRDASTPAPCARSGRAGASRSSTCRAATRSTGPATTSRRLARRCSSGGPASSSPSPTRPTWRAASTCRCSSSTSATASSSPSTSRTRRAGAGGCRTPRCSRGTSASPWCPPSRRAARASRSWRRPILRVSAGGGLGTTAGTPLPPATEERLEELAFHIATRADAAGLVTPGGLGARAAAFAVLEGDADVTRELGLDSRRLPHRPRRGPRARDLQGAARRGARAGRGGSGHPRSPPTAGGASRRRRGPASRS